MEVPNTVALLCFIFFFLLTQNVAAEKRLTYIVHMDKPSMPKAFSSHHFWYSSILTSLHQPSAAAAAPKIIYTYDHAFHGFSVRISQTELETLKSSPGFISAYADDVVSPDTTHTPDFLSLNSAAGIWPASNYGKDVIIGVIDTGIWPENPSFSDRGMTAVQAKWRGVCDGGDGFNSSLCNKKIIGARYFNRGANADDPSNPEANTARDDDGHGSHVSSIAAGNFVESVSFFGYAAGTARGVAPRARIAVYKALWGGGGVSSDILAGIDQAVADGVDILSISIGAQEINLYANPLSIGSFGAREKGILVCLSAGNRGPFTRSIRSGIPWAVVVASATVDRWFAGTLTLGNGKAITGWSTFPARSVVKNLPLFYNETLSGCSDDDLEAAAAAGGGGSIILCNTTDRNTDFDSVMRSLSDSNSGIRAGIVIDEDPSIFRFNTFPYPGVVVTAAQGSEIENYIKSSSSPTATITFRETIIGEKPRAAPALSDDSSQGPGRSYEGILKPDLLAPGVLILAAYHPLLVSARIGRNIDLSSDYNLLSGTSMACPHISGTAALLKAAHPEWTPAAIQSAMMTTANPLDNTNNPIREQDDTLATPLGIGSGHVDPNRALDPGLVYDTSVQDLVDLVCSMNFTREQTQTIVRSSYNCSSPSSDLNYPSFVALIRAADIGKTLTTRFRRAVTNVGGGAATYKPIVEAPVNTTVTIKPLSLVFAKKNQKLSYSLTIRYEGNIDIQHKVGTLTWVDGAGKYKVRSPIMVSAAADNFE